MVATTDKYRRLVEKRRRSRRGVLLPIRVSTEGRTLFEGATLDVSVGGVYFRMPGGEQLAVGMRLSVEVNVPAEHAGGAFGVRAMRDATVVRVENDSLACKVGCRPRDCGVGLAFDPEVLAPAVRQGRAFVAVA